MLQRIQTIFLIVATLATFSLILPFLSLASLTGDLTTLSTSNLSVLDDGIFHTRDNVFLTLLVILASALSGIAVFQFKNRMRQLFLTRFAIIANVMVLLLAVLFFYLDYENLSKGAYDIDPEWGPLLVLIAILFCYLAIRAVKKDERLVRSMDRLR